MPKTADPSRYAVSLACRSRLRWHRRSDGTVCCRGYLGKRYRNKYHELVRSMRPGDDIAIKASYTRKHGLPFDNAGDFVSVIGIKGHWNDPGESRRRARRSGSLGADRADQGMVLLSDRATVWRVIPGDWRTDALIAVVFDHVSQDMERFQRWR